MPDFGRLREPLTDRYGRVHDYLRISLTDRCNFRCIYCMPEEGVDWKAREEILSFEEIVRLTNLFAQMGVRKVRLTGGEPTVRKGFLSVAADIRAIPGIDSLWITTNGTNLPQLAVPMREAGFTGVNVSLDSLNVEKFHEITRRQGLGQVLEGIEAVLKTGIQAKVNVVVMPGINDDEILEFVSMTRDLPLEVRFIEFMPFLGNQWQSDRVISSRELRDRISEKYPLTPLDGHPSDVATRFRIAGFKGIVGFVSSVTESFCSGCSRVRLTADGQFKTCLFLPPIVSLRDLIRSGASDDDIEQAIRIALQSKWAGHPTMDRWQQLDSLSMVQIGG